MPFISFVDSVIFRNLYRNPEPWLACAGTFDTAFVLMVVDEAIAEDPFTDPHGCFICDQNPCVCKVN